MTWTQLLREAFWEQQACLSSQDMWGKPALTGLLSPVTRQARAAVQEGISRLIRMSGVKPTRLAIVQAEEPGLQVEQGLHGNDINHALSLIGNIDEPHRHGRVMPENGFEVLFVHLEQDTVGERGHCGIAWCILQK